MTDLATALSQCNTNDNNQAVLLALDKPSLTLNDLKTLITARTNDLLKAGATSSSLIALCLPKSVETAEVFLTLCSQFCCFPINPAATQAELSDLLKRSPTELIIAPQGSTAETVATKLGIATANITVSKNGGFTWGHLPQVPLFSSKEKKLQAGSVLLATSGSTAAPKLVLLSSAMLVKSAQNMARTVSLSATDQCLNMMPLFHVGGLVDLLIAPLLAGGSVIVTETINTRTFFRCLDTYQPTWYQGVPAMLRDITMAEQVGGNKHRDQLRFIRAVSSALPPSLMPEIQRVFGCPVISIYGMTETTGVITSQPLNNSPQHYNSVGISAGPDLQIKHHSGRGAKPGETGEIFVKGDTVISDYYSQPKKQTPDSHEWFATGDLGHFCKEKQLYLSGRIKDIINRGGEKISPLEIDHCLLDLSGIKDAAAFAVPHPSLGEEVAIAVVTHAGQDISEEAILEWLRPRLSAHKIPRQIYFTTALPVGSSGKMQRRTLSETYGSTIPQPATDRPTKVNIPADTQALIAIWKPLLGVETIGIDDNFFDLGGDSLAAANFSAEFDELTNVQLPLSALHEHPTPRSMTQYLNQLPQNPGLAAYHREYLPDSGLPATVYKQLRHVMSGWKGSRHHPQSLIVGQQLNGQRAPLFWVSPDHEHLTELTRHLGPEQPIYGMRSLLKMSCYTPQNSRALARHFAQEITEIQPNGPYLIGGYCAGGDLAVNLCYELTLRGADIPLTVLIDTNSNAEHPLDSDVLLFYSRTSRIAPNRSYVAPSRGWFRAYRKNLYVQPVNLRHSQMFRPKKSHLIGLALQQALAKRDSGTLAWNPTQAALIRHSERLYNAQIHCKAPKFAMPGRQITLPVRVRNRSPETWEPTEKSGLILGACFNKPHKKPRQILAGHHELTRQVHPGESIIVNLVIKIPWRIRTMTLQIDMIDDGVDWFSRRGSTPFETTIQLRPFAQLFEYLASP